MVYCVYIRIHNFDKDMNPFILALQQFFYTSGFGIINICVLLDKETIAYKHFEICSH